MVETTAERLRFTSDEVAAAEGFRVKVGVVATGTDLLGKEGGKIPGVTGSGLVGRGTREPTCSQRLTGAPRRRGLGRSRLPELCLLKEEARKVIEVAAMRNEGCWSEGRGYI